jgi:hypothetical protein
MRKNSTVFKEEFNVSNSEKFLTVKDAAIELKLKINQIKNLISQKLIEYKLEKGILLVDINSIDELVMIDLNKGENVYPRRKNYNFRLNKPTDKENNIKKNIIKNINNNFIKNNVIYENKNENVLFFLNNCKICDNNSNDRIQTFISQLIYYYHTYNKNIFEFTFFPIENGKISLKIFNKSISLEEDIISLVVIKNHCKYADGIYFINGEKCYNYSFITIEKDLINYVYENCIFYLTLDDLIKELSPPKYYNKNKAWSMILDQTDYDKVEASNDENINNRYPMEPHKVNGHWRVQPFGNRNNPQYKKIWINDFEKGGKRYKKVA